MKKLLSALVMAGLLAGLGCGGDTGAAKDKDKKDKSGPTAPAKEKDKKDKTE